MCVNFYNNIKNVPPHITKFMTSKTIQRIFEQLDVGFLCKPVKQHRLGPVRDC